MAGGAQPDGAGDRPRHQPDHGDGVHVEWGNPQGPAAAAGLRPGDVIFAIGTFPVEQLGAISEALTHRVRPGDTVEIRYARGTGEQVVRVTLGEKPAPYGGPA